MDSHKKLAINAALAGFWAGVAVITASEQPFSKGRLAEKERDQIRTGVRRISWILRETDQLLNAIEVQPERDQYMVGIIKNRIHRGFKIVRGREVSNNIGMARLAEIHQFGRGHDPARPLMVLPNRPTSA